MNMKTSLQLLSVLTLAFGVVASGCAENPNHLDLVDNHDKDDEDPIGDEPEKQGNLPEDSVGGEDTTFDHENDYRDPYEIALQRAEEGSPDTRARLHSCQKLQITALRNILTDFGVDLARESDPPSAGELLDAGGTALGQSNYPARTGEDLVWTAAGAAKTFDIFVQAAPEIIAAMPSLEKCQIDGAGSAMFDESDPENPTCNDDAVSCLIGRPATPEHLAICNNLVKSGSTLETGKNIAVAALLSAAHSCE
jgi:hypothetical protein